MCAYIHFVFIFSCRLYTQLREQTRDSCPPTAEPDGCQHASSQDSVPAISTVPAIPAIPAISTVYAVDAIFAISTFFQ